MNEPEFVIGRTEPPVFLRFTINDNMLKITYHKHDFNAKCECDNPDFYALNIGYAELERFRDFLNYFLDKGEMK